MALSLITKKALNAISKFEPALSKERNGGKPILLGDLLDSALAGGDIVAPLKVAATPTAVADATDLPTAIALVNDLKAKFNALTNGIDNLP